jgi:hypothetical protein
MVRASADHPMKLRNFIMAHNNGIRFFGFAAVLAAVAVGCAAESSGGDGTNPFFTGGATASGGVTGTGAVAATGGAVGTGGYTATGGAVGTGGVVATGGAVGTGGAVATGGAVGTGGTTAVACTGAATLDGYLDNGTMCGYAWTAGYDGGTIDPPCGTAGPCFTGATICATGELAAADDTAMTYPGIMIGWNVSQASGATTSGTWAATGTGLTPTFTVTGATGDVRLVVQTAGGDYCAKATSGTAIPWASFVTNCWTGGTPQTPLPAGAAIKAVAVQVNSSTAAQSITNFCLTSITN